MSLILVTGGSGEIGKYVVEFGLAHNFKVRAGSRNPEKTASSSHNDKIEWVKLDFEDPSTFAPALAGVDYVYLYRGSNHQQFVDEAKKAGVKFIVFNSTLLLGVHEPSIFKVFHEPAELAIKASGIPYLFLRGGEYYKNIRGIAHGVKSGHLQVTHDYKTVKTFYISERDLAEVAVTAFTRPIELNGSTPTLIYPEKFSIDDIVAIIGKKIGKDIVVSEISDAEFEASEAYVKFGYPKVVYDGLLKYRKDIAAGVFEIKASTDVEKILGKPARALEEWVDENIAYFK